MRVLITGGAKEVESHVAGLGDPQATPKLTENLAVELKNRPIAVLSYDPGMVDVGLMGRGSWATPDDPDSQRVAQWAKSQRERSMFTPVEQSTAVLVRMVNGEFDHRSGELITPKDSLKDALKNAPVDDR